jgi:hypothetical protein
MGNTHSTRAEIQNVDVLDAFIKSRWSFTTETRQGTAAQELDRRMDEYVYEVRDKLGIKSGDAVPSWMLATDVLVKFLDFCNVLFISVGMFPADFPEYVRLAKTVHAI